MDKIELPTEKHATVRYTRGPRECKAWFRGDFWIVEDGIRTGLYTREELTARLNSPAYPVTDYRIVTEDETE